MTAPRPRIVLVWRNWWDDVRLSWGLLVAPQWLSGREHEGKRVEAGLRVQVSFGPSRYLVEDGYASRYSLWPMRLSIEWGKGPDPLVSEWALRNPKWHRWAGWVVPRSSLAVFSWREVLEKSWRYRWWLLRCKLARAMERRARLA